MESIEFGVIYQQTQVLCIIFTLLMDAYLMGDDLPESMWSPNIDWEVPKRSMPLFSQREIDQLDEILFSSPLESCLENQGLPVQEYFCDLFGEEDSRKELSAPTMEPEVAEPYLEMEGVTKIQVEQSSYPSLKKAQKEKKCSTKVDNEKNYALNAVKALRRQLDSSEVASLLFEEECLKRGAKVETVKRLISELTKGHLSLAKLKRHVNPRRGDSHFEVREAFGAYFDIFMQHSFEAYVWSSAIVEKTRCVEYGLKCLANLREGASNPIRSQITP